MRHALLHCCAEGIKLLQDDGATDVDPMGDLNTELERRLGKIVKDKYDTDFYILHRYPMAVSQPRAVSCSSRFQQQESLRGSA